jgi:hypothetical protein
VPTGPPAANWTPPAGTAAGTPADTRPTEVPAPPHQLRRRTMRPAWLGPTAGHNVVTSR